jgi:hypothetical protein
VVVVRNTGTNEEGTIMAKIEIGEYVVLAHDGETIEHTMDALVVGIDVAYLITKSGDAETPYTVVVAGEPEQLKWFEGRHNGDASFV